jgi:hypothetical protein
VPDSVKIAISSTEDVHGAMLVAEDDLATSVDLRWDHLAPTWFDVLAPTRSGSDAAASRGARVRRRVAGGQQP